MQISFKLALYVIQRQQKIDFNHENSQSMIYDLTKIRELSGLVRILTITAFLQN